SAQTNNSDNYFVIVSDNSGAITSAVATLVVYLPVNITAQPQSQTVPAGADVTLSVTASGTEPLIYQWWNSAGAILDATNDSYLLESAQTNNSDNYFVIVSNDYGAITSAVAALVVYLPVNITSQPQSQTVPAGADVTLSVTANGTAPLIYQWQFNGTNLPNDIITTVAGGGNGGDGGAATNANLNIPYGVSVDAMGDLFVADTGNQRIRKVDTNGIITTVAGNGVWGYSGDGGAATNASFLFPIDVTVDSSGNLFIADQDNHRVREVNTNGIITTVVGNGMTGYAGDGGAATNASLKFPRGITLDAAGNLFVVDSGSCVIRKVDTNGIITTMAGNGTAGYSGDGGAATNASLNQPNSVAVDALGNLFIADSGNGIIRRVDTTGLITTVAGNSRTNQYGFVGGYSGDGGAATNASLYYPYRVVVGASGNLFIADLNNNRIRQVAPTTDPAITIYNLTTNNAGNYTVIVSNPFGSITSSIATITLALPPSISVQPLDQSVEAGTAATLSVTASGTAPLGYQWWNSTGAILEATNASYVLNPAQTNNSDNYFVVVTNAYGAITSAVAALVVYLPVNLTDQPQSGTVPAGANVTLSVTANGTGPFGYQWLFNGTNLLKNLITTVAGNGVQGYSGDGGAATNASLSYPSGVAEDASENLFIADYYNNRIRKVDTSGLITTVAGNGTAADSGDGGAATNASLSYPSDLALDAAGNLFIADSQNSLIRKVDTNSIITSVAGNGMSGYSGDGGAATNASLSYPSAVAVDASGDLYIADRDNHCIRQVDTNGIITTVAGNGAQGYFGDGAAATNASLSYPSAVAVDADGNLLIADTGNQRIRQVDTNGLITTVAGNGNQGYSGDGGAATNASLNQPNSVVVDAFGNLFIADAANGRIREVDAAGLITTVAGNGTSGYSGDGGAATNASLYYPTDTAVDAFGNLFIADLENHRIRRVALTTDPTITIYNLTTNNAGNYTVIVSNPFGSITSIVAVVSLGPPPSISVQPVGQGVAAGTSATLSVTASSIEPLGYQWWNSAGAILDATNASFMINPAETNNSDNYFVVITNVYGATTSSVAALVVYSPVNITGQPASQVVPALSTVTFDVAAEGYPALIYQWTFNNTNLPGAMSSTLVISNVLLTDLGDYAVLVGNGYSSNTSATATLSMSPSITTPYVGSTAVWGYSATLSVGAIGTGLLSYQWFQNGIAVADATNPVFSLPNVQFTNGGPYSVVVSSDLGSVTNSGPLVVSPAGLALGMEDPYAGITITGVSGYSYIIQSTSDLADTNSWITLTNLTLEQPIELWVDTSTNARVVPQRFYRVLPGQ
ncbi:MAG TPA: hypothetical protein VMJ12_14505, partial [Candidatus Acidoferrales bacterium]|nr:hypothetical protein [Candidatus Acidoferrales bacterium]